MIHDIKIPELGESVREGTIVAWTREEGAAVAAAEPLLELETDKVTVEVVSPAAGRLSISVPAGETVTVGQTVGRVDDAAAGDAPSPSPPAPTPPTPAEAAPPPIAPPAGLPQAKAKLAGAAGPDTPLSPAVRRLVAEQGLDPAAIAGTGRGGRLTKEDVVLHLEKGAAPAAPVAAPLPSPAAGAAEGPRQTRRPMSRLRQRIAERLVQAKSEAAILTTFNEVDMSKVMEWRARHKDAFKAKHGVALGFMSFFVKAAVDALRTVPELNAQVDGDEIVQNHYYDIGVAVGTDQGLVVPVVRGCDRLGHAGIERAIADLAARARDRRLGLEDLQGAVFTISNGGIYGSMLSTPILNPPQSGILGLHAIKKRPVVVDDQIVIRPMMYLALSYDHRIVDGKEAVTFLRRVVECVEHPERSMLEV